jgi:hypothetical protein
MVSNIIRIPPTCIYCANAIRKQKRGEHIVPEAIGGGLTLNQISEKRVCNDCNSTFLSRIDDELCKRSYLSAIASQVLGNDIWQSWDVDTAANNLLIEARPLWVDEMPKSFVCWPQIIFERNGPAIRGDLADMEHIGAEEYEKVLSRAVKAAFERYCKNAKKSLHIERVRTSSMHDRYRFPPRVYTPRSILQIAKKVDQQSFTLRYLTDDDKRFAFDSMSKLNEKKQFKNRSISIGSHEPLFSIYFDAGEAVRGLMKIGLNLVAAYCDNTPVNSETFRDVIALIRGPMSPSPQLLASNGFVPPENLAVIKADGHSFRLTHFDNLWHVYFSFFSGRICAYVWFPGTNYEKWKTADIIAPLKSKDWTLTPRGIITVPRIEVEWKDASKIHPSFKLQYSRTELKVELERAKPRQKA